MKQTLKSVRLVATLITIGSLAAEAQGALSIIIQDSGSDIVVTYSGSVDLTGLTLSGTGFASGGIGTNGSVPFVAISGTSSTVSVNIYTGLTSFPTSPIAASITTGDTHTGDRGFGVQTFSGGIGRIFVPNGYISESPLSAVQSFSGRSITSMGLQPGSYEWVWGSDKATVTIVPEPSSVLLFGLGAMGFASRRRRNK